MNAGPERPRVLASAGPRHSCHASPNATGRRPSRSLRQDGTRSKALIYRRSTTDVRHSKAESANGAGCHPPREGTTMRRLVKLILMTVVALALTAQPAMAHECYIASRSWQGNLMAGTHSQAWFLVDLNQEFAAEVSAGQLTQAEADCLLTTLPSNGVPLQFTLHVKGAVGQDGVLADNNPNTWLVSNGKGVDHFFDVYGAQIAASFAACNVPFGV